MTRQLKLFLAWSSRQLKRQCTKSKIGNWSIPLLWLSCCHKWNQAISKASAHGNAEETLNDAVAEEKAKTTKEHIG